VRIYDSAEFYTTLMLGSSCRAPKLRSLVALSLFP
jgi:hypothetical protein